MEKTTTATADTAPPAQMPPGRQIALARFLAGHGLAGAGPQACAPDMALRITRLTAGYSNLTWRVDARGAPLVVRQAPPGVHIRGAYDVAREYESKIGMIM